MSMIDPVGGTEEKEPNAFVQTKDKLTKLINGFSAGQRATLMIAGVGVVALVLAVSWVQSNPPMAPLYTNLSNEDVAAVTKKLQETGVDYQITAGGTTVEVPEDQVYQLRADTSELSLSGGKVGYGILDDQALTASDFSQQVGFQRAMEGEMSKTIEAMAGVEKATVHLAIPKQQVFALDEEKPSASVLVKTKSVLGSEQVQAITNIVANGIQGMSPDRVSVNDSEGHVLAAPGKGVTGSGGGSASEAQSKYEGSLSSAIENMLATAYGPGRARVQVTARMSYDEKNTTKETFVPSPTAPSAAGQLMLNETNKTEAYGADGAAPAGMLGTNGQQQAGGAANSGYNLNQKDVKYAVDHVVETTKQAPGKVERISVAVMVDSALGANLADVEALVTAAAGVDANRNDTIKVTQVAFDKTQQDAMKKELAAKVAAAEGTDNSIIVFAAAGAIALLIMISTFLVLRRRKKDLRALEELVEELNVAEEEAEMAGYAMPAGNDGASVDPRFANPDGSAPASPAAREERKAVLSDLIDNQPDEVAQLLRGWLGDRRAVKR